MDLTSIIATFAADFAPAAWRLLWVIAFLVGTLYIASSLVRMWRANSVQGSPPVTFGDIVPVMLVGACMANLSGFINTTWNSFGTGTVSYGAVAYGGAASFGSFEPAINAVLTLVSFAGGVFAFKGVALLKKSSMDGHSNGGSEDTTWRAITHLLFGAMLVQIHQAIDWFRESFGLYW